MLAEVSPHTSGIQSTFTSPACRRALEVKCACGSHDADVVTRSSETPTQVNVLEVEKEAFIKSTDGSHGIDADEHAPTAHPVHVGDATTVERHRVAQEPTDSATRTSG